MEDFNAIDAKSKRAVRFVTVEGVRKMARHIGVAEMICNIANIIEADFRRWAEFEKTARLTHATGKGFIELMPVSDGKHYAFKYINCHPANANCGLQTVAGFGVLARVDTGQPVLLAEMTLLTAMRTAATSVMAASLLAPKNARTMAIIGNGAQCEFQALAFNRRLGIDTFRLFDIDTHATEKSARNLLARGLKVVNCRSAEEAVQGAEIITTCTADIRNATVLTDNMVGKDVYINAIGGDCAGKTELHVDLLKRADIYVEFLPQTRCEGEIQQLAPDHPVTELWRVLSGEIEVERKEGLITIFDSVGFAIEDFSALNYVYEMTKETGICDYVDLLARPDDPRDLFGVLE